MKSTSTQPVFHILASMYGELAKHLCNLDGKTEPKYWRRIMDEEIPFYWVKNLKTYQSFASKTMPSQRAESTD